jgi:hypothetical protein
MTDRKLLDWLFLFLGVALMVGAYLWQQSTVASASPGQDGALQPARTETKAVQQDEPTPDDAPMSVWMEKKLRYSQELLRLLAVGDLDELQATAHRMKLVSKVEGFVRSNNATYTNHLRVFQLANEELIRQAERENIEGATLAFHQLTSSCVSCHVAIRQGLNPPK